MTAADAARAAPVPSPQAPGRELRVEVTPPWPFRLRRRSSMDGLTRARNGVLHRLLHIEDRPVVVRVAQLSSGNVLFGASEPEAIARMRRALGVDLDLADFHARFRDDPLIGAAVRRNPTLRPMGKPDAFEAFAAAVTEQLIEFDRAVAIQRRMIAVLGRRHGDLRDAPTAAAVAATSPARFESFDLVGKRALTLVRAAREIASGRADLNDPERAFPRLARIPGVGPWTLEMTALVGLGRLDQIPAGDLGFIKLVGRLKSGGDPRARALESDVRALFAPYGEYRGLAGAYALAGAGVPFGAIV